MSNRVLDEPLSQLSAYELVQNVEHGCRRIPSSVTWGELGWPRDYHIERCSNCRSCTALAILDRAIKAKRTRTKGKR